MQILIDMSAIVDKADKLVKGTVNAAADLVPTSKPSLPGKSQFGSLRDKISEFIRSFVDLLKKAFNNLKDGVLGLRDPAKKLFNQAVDLLKKTFNTLKDGVTGLQDPAKKLFNQAVDLLKNAYNSLKDGVTGLRDPAKKLFNQAVDLLKKTFSTLTDSAKKAGKFVLDTINKMLGKAGELGKAAKSKVGG